MAAPAASPLTWTPPMIRRMARSSWRCSTATTIRWCYLPVAGFVRFNDEPEQYLFTTVLRPGNAPASRGAMGILRRIVTLVRRWFPGVRIRIRLDGGFARSAAAGDSRRPARRGTPGSQSSVICARERTRFQSSFAFRRLCRLCLPLSSSSCLPLSSSSSSSSSPSLDLTLPAMLDKKGSSRVISE